MGDQESKNRKTIREVTEMTERRAAEMETRGSFKPYQSIRFRLLLLMSLIAASAVFVIAVIAVSSTQLQGRTTQEASGRALRQQAESYLLQLTISSAKEYDLSMAQIAQEAGSLAHYATSLYENPYAFDSQAFWNYEEHLLQGSEGHYLNPASDLSSVFIPNNKEITEELVQDIELSAYLDLVFPNIIEKNANIEAIYFATPNQVVRYFPNIELGTIIPPDFQVSERDWFSGSLPEVNPEKTSWWTAVYLDATGRGAVTTAASPVFTKDGELVGVVGLDVSLKEMKNKIEGVKVLESGYSFLIDETGHAIALSDRGYLDVMGYPYAGEDARVDLSSTQTAFGPIIRKMTLGESGFGTVKVAGKELFVAYAPLESTGWSQASVVAASEVLRSVAQLETELQDTTRSLVLQRILPASALIFILVFLVGWVITNHLMKPIRNLAAAAQEIRAGRWDIKLPVVGNDEIGLLALAFKDMTERLHEVFAEMEKRVVERTLDLERRSNQVQVAAEVARDAATSQVLDVLLNRAVNLVRERFGFYHAGIFLLDDAREYAVLRSATGEAGQIMLERGHKLKVGQEGIVGFVSGTGEPRISLDVGVDAVHFKNPILPETRSEMSLPLRAGDTVIGVLDVQSKQAAAFDEEDITILQTMADQLAVAIQNARLLKEAQENLQQMQMLYGLYNLDAWESLKSTRSVAGYQIDSSGLRAVPVLLNGDSGKQEVSPDLPPISRPIDVRGRTIGYLEVWPDQEQVTSEEANFIDAISERISLALESARIFEETRSLAFREETLNQIISHFNQSLDFNSLVESALTQLWQLPNVSEVSIYVGPPEVFTPNELEKGGGDNGSNGKGGEQ
jgi:GAF domain-containing protein/HAMP domain-containing protein